MAVAILYFEGMSTGPDYDLIIVGGGLSGSLLAWRLRQQRPDLHVALIEASTMLGGNHTWSFFSSDLTVEQNAWLEPLVCYSWPAYVVRFPKRTRTLQVGYRSITSDRLAEVVLRALGSSIILNAPVAVVGETQVQLADQRTLTARCVIDACASLDT